MQNQAIRIFIFSSLAIFALAAVWGVRQIPARGELGDRVLRESLDQELIVLSSAVKSSTQSLKYKLLDVLKAEGNDHATRTFEDSPFQAASLFEWDQTQWKTLWYSVKSKTDLQSSELKNWLQEWPLAKIAPDEVYINRVTTIQGQSYFVILVPVRKPNQIPMVGMGIFPASQFGLTFSADENRDIRVFNSSGFALALSHPAYLGSSLKSDPLVQEILERDDVSLRQEWTSDRGTPMLGVVTRLNNSNLFAAIETKAQTTPSWPMWMYLLLCATGAAALNWVLFNSLLRPLLNELTKNEVQNENLRRQIAEGTSVIPAPSTGFAPAGKLNTLDFVDDSAPEVMGSTAAHSEAPKGGGQTSLERVIQASLNSMNPLIRDHHVQVLIAGLEDLTLGAEPLQLQTAVEEVLKNAIEAMLSTESRLLRITGHRLDDKISLVIEDTGVGISEADLSKVFDPFFSSKDFQGVARGLGLNVVRRVVEELGGKVYLSSRGEGSDRGTRVELTWRTDRSAAPNREDHLHDLGEELNELVEQIVVEPRIGRLPWTPGVHIRKPIVRALD